MRLFLEASGRSGERLRNNRRSEIRLFIGGSYAGIFQVICIYLSKDCIFRCYI